MAIDPRESGRIEIHFVQGALLPIRMVQVPQPAAVCLVHGLFQQMPVEARITFHSFHCPNSAPMNTSFLPG